MPVKDALGRDIGVDYTDDISIVRDILDATIARRNIFIDSVELQKLTLEQVAHIHSYEKDATIAMNWINDLYKVMIKTHIHVGCNVYEIQLQKEELQSLQETAKVSQNLFKFMIYYRPHRISICRTHTITVVSCWMLHSLYDNRVSCLSTLIEKC